MQLAYASMHALQYATPSQLKIPFRLDVGLRQGTCGQEESIQRLMCQRTSSQHCIFI